MEIFCNLAGTISDTLYPLKYHGSFSTFELQFLLLTHCFKIVEMLHSVFRIVNKSRFT